MADEVFSPRSAPLIIRNQDEKSGEHFTLDGAYLLTLEEFEASKQVLRHTMAAPGFYLERSGSIRPEHRPENRPSHCHDCLELMVVLNGTLTQTIEGETRVYTEGQCCILSRNLYHVEAYSSDFEVGFLLLSDEFLRFVIEQDVRFLRFDAYCAADDPLYEELRRPKDGFRKNYLDLIPLSGAEDCPKEQDTASGLMRRILNETKSQKPGFIPIVSGCVARLLRLLADPHRYRLQRVELSGSREDLIYSEVLRCLHAHAGRVVHEDLERTLHYTRDYMNRIVRRRTGMSLVELGHEISLEKAAFLLRTTDRSVGAILQELHYTNRTYFYRIFREKFGMTPKAYRQNICAKKNP